MVFRGLNDLDAAFDVVTSLAVLGVVSGLAYSLGFPLPLWLVAAIPLFAAGLSLGSWYQVRIGPERIELREFRSWVLPQKPRIFALDADVDLYDTLDSPRPQGLFIKTPDIAESDSEAFGPYFSLTRMQRRRDAMQAAIERARASVPTPPNALRLGLLDGNHAALDLAAARRNEQGRFRELSSTAPITIGNVVLPSGTVFILNRDGFIDPSRADTLHRVRLTTAIELANGLNIDAGAELVFDEGGNLNVVHGAAKEPLSLQGHTLRGDEPIGFGPSGRLETYTLAEAKPLGEFLLPAGTKVTAAIKIDILPYRTTAWLGDTLTLPEVELRPGESMYFDGDDQLVAISPRRDLLLFGYRVRYGYVPIPTQPDGTIDIRKCRDSGIVGEV